MVADNIKNAVINLQRMHISLSKVVKINSVLLRKEKGKM